MDILITQGTLLLLLLLGIIARKTGIISLEGKKTIANLLYYFALPALFLSEVSKIDPAAIHPDLILGSILPIAALMLLLWLLKISRLISRDNYIILNLAVCFGSNAFFGIPFFANLYGSDGQRFAILSAMLLGVSGIILTTAIFEFLVHKQDTGKSFKRLLTNPIILAILGGIILSLLPFRLTIIDKAASMLGQAAGSLAIMILGMFLVDNFDLQALKKAFLFGLFRLTALPVVTCGLVLLFLNHGGEDTKFIIIQSGMPAAVSIAVFAEKYNWKQDIIAGIVIITSLASFLSLSGLYFLTEYF